MSVDVPSQLESALDRFVAHAGRTRDQVVTAALEEYLSEQNDLLLAAETRRGVLDGSIATVSLQELMDRYGVER